MAAANEREGAVALQGLLRRHGLPSDFAVCIGQLAKTIRDHAHFERLLTSIEPDFRYEFYEAVSPHLAFDRWPLDRYVASAGRKAEQQKLPTIDQDGNLRQFHSAEFVIDAEAALARAMAKRALILMCSKCTKEQIFYAVGEETAVAVIMKARKAGWIYDYRVDPGVEICPNCPT